MEGIMSKKIIICITVLLFSGFIYAKGAFVEVGDPSFFPDSFYSLLSLEADKKGNVYVAFVEDILYLSIAKFDGEKWTYAGPEKFSGKIGNVRSQYDATDSLYVSFAVDGEGVPHAAFPAFDSYDLQVKKYDESKNRWNNLAGLNDFNFKVKETHISFSPENIPYIAISGCSSDACKEYNEETDYEYTYDAANVAKFKNDEWIYIGEPMFGFNEETPMASSCSSMVFDSKNTPYAVYSDNDGVKIIKFDGTDWVQVGGYLQFGGELMIDSSDNLYFGMYSGLYKYNDGKWDNLFQIDSKQGVSYVVYNDIVYVAFSVHLNNDAGSALKVGVKKYENGKLETVGDNEFFAVGRDASIAVDDNGIPYVAFVKDGEVVLMKYDPETGETPDDSDEDETADEDKKDSGSSGCGLILL